MALYHNERVFLFDVLRTWMGKEGGEGGGGGGKEGEGGRGEGRGGGRRLKVERARADARMWHKAYARLCIRSFLTQSDLSIENYLLRLNPKSGILKSRKRDLSTQLFSTGSHTFSTRSPSRKTQSKKFSTCFLNPSHRSSHHKTHTYTPTHPYQVPHSSIIQQRRRWLGYHCCCFSPQVSVAYS